MISRDGQAALVADVYQQWVSAATPDAAQDASVLFENADNPGDPQVQAILKTPAEHRGVTDVISSVGGTRPRW